MKKSFAVLLIFGVVSTFLFSACSYNIAGVEHNVWKGFTGLFTAVEATDAALYESMIPEQFTMPTGPMLVGIFIVDYYDTEHWPIRLLSSILLSDDIESKLPLLSVTNEKRLLPLLPYKEASVLIRVNYEGADRWYPLTMPVDTIAALQGGLSLGFPKYLADEIVYQETSTGLEAAVMLDDTVKIGLEFTPQTVDPTGLPQWQQDFLAGTFGSDANEPIVLLNPPAVGPDVVANDSTPPPLREREIGMVAIELDEPYASLIPAGVTSAPGMYQRFDLDGEW